MFKVHTLPTTPGAIIGYRKDGRPIRAIAGGAPVEGEGREGQPQGDPQSGGPEAGVTPPAQQAPSGPDPLAAARQKEEQVNPDALRVDQLPEWGQKLFQNLRKEAGDYRAELRDVQKALEEAKQTQGPSRDEIAQQVQADFVQQIGKALGLVGDEQKELTPEQVIETLTAERDTTAKERDEEKDRHRRALMELAVHRQGLKLGADPDALLDSRSFLKKVRDLDTDAQDFAAKLGEVIELAVTENPKFKAGSLAGPPSRSGGEFAGGPGGRTPSSEPSIDDFRKQRAKRSSQ
ncbi:hypothetical protein [Nonomuraea basaltis]|uniref:hypothetical protein n=1 Tax=Nonomuraea basaltis TaxID=2495887 RepID=UPI00110C567B|nr:hypothetical protein [Nonomuraea basaltis]TMR99519.1 hypothetical protein EJK15_06820 [Nonomuraea basaltis]